VTKPVKQAAGPKRPRNPTLPSARDALSEARAALATGDNGKAVRMAQRSYSEQDNLAARLIALRVYCEKGDLANVRAVSRVMDLREMQEVVAECQTHGIDLAP
ncbi:hypothetical protein D7V97_42170, partial [Corallococcus sp. CA053C]|uniref:hypothetical protein n=1 Tax=Corallococcus sp. CA053C TaxID=2316732 RepID=UPI000ED20325